MNKTTTFVSVHSVTSYLSSLSGALKYLSGVVLGMRRSLLSPEATSQRDWTVVTLHLCVCTWRAVGAFLCPIYLLIILLRILRLVWPWLSSPGHSNPEHCNSDSSHWERARVLSSFLKNWSNLGSSQQSGRVWEAFPHSPSHGPVFSVQWNRKGGGFSFLPSISGSRPSLFVTGDFQDSRSLEIGFLKIISAYIYLLSVSKDQHCFIFIM